MFCVLTSEVPLSRILLVDDDADVRRLVKKILERDGFHVVTIDNGLSALDELNNNHYDLLISDANMPQYSGFDLIRALKRHPRHENLIIAMLTGRKEIADIQEAIQLGVKDYIIKPIEPLVLIKKVQKLLGEEDEEIIESTRAVSIDLEAKFTGHLQIVALSETHVHAVSEFPLPEGFELSVECESLLFIKNKLLKVKIHNCSKDLNDPTMFAINAIITDKNPEVTKGLKQFLSRYRVAG